MVIDQCKQTSVCFSSGAWEWEFLEEALAEKLKNPLAVAQLMERIRSFIGREKVTGVEGALGRNYGYLFLCIVHYSIL